MFNNPTVCIGATNVSVRCIDMDCQHVLAKVHGAAEALRGQTLHTKGIGCVSKMCNHTSSALGGCLGKAMSKIWMGNCTW